MKRIFCIILSLFVLAGCGRFPGSGEYASTMPLMGTFVQIKISSPGYARSELERSVDEVFELARKLEKKFSAFDPGSEANALNIAGTRKVSPELFALIRQAKRISSITDGEFDITVAPILKADGFYKDMPAELRDRIPQGVEGIGWRNVTLKLDGKSVTLRKGAWIDLSGIAKGYIVDRMADLLRSKGITGVMINAGGDIYCGHKGKNGAWKIGVRKPGSRTVDMTLDIKDMAVATSGDYENVVIDNRSGEPISHIIDPFYETAKREIPSSITVVAPTCAEADALATGMMAMGTDKAIALADTMEEVKIIAIECPEGQRTVRFSKGAEKYVVGR